MSDTQSERIEAILRDLGFYQATIRPLNPGGQHTGVRIWRAPELAAYIAEKLAQPPAARDASGAPSNWAKTLDQLPDDQVLDMWRDVQGAWLTDAPPSDPPALADAIRFAVARMIGRIPAAPSAPAGEAPDYELSLTDGGDVLIRQYPQRDRHPADFMEWLAECLADAGRLGANVIAWQNKAMEWGRERDRLAQRVDVLERAARGLLAKSKAVGVLGATEISEAEEHLDNVLAGRSPAGDQP